MQTRFEDFDRAWMIILNESGAFVDHMPYCYIPTSKVVPLFKTKKEAEKFLAKIKF